MMLPPPFAAIAGAKDWITLKDGAQIQIHHTVKLIHRVVCDALANVRGGCEDERGNITELLRSSGHSIMVQHVQGDGAGAVPDHRGCVGRCRAVAVCTDNGCAVRAQGQGGFAADAAAAADHHDAAARQVEKLSVIQGTDSLCWVGLGCSNSTGGKPLDGAPNVLTRGGSWPSGSR